MTEKRGNGVVIAWGMGNSEKHIHQPEADGNHGDIGMKAENWELFPNLQVALNTGYHQCYDCFPDPAASGAWQSQNRTVTALQALANRTGVGEVYLRLRNGVQGILSADAYRRTVGYTLRLDNGSVTTLMLIRAVPSCSAGGMRLSIHATRVEQHMGLGMDSLRALLPPHTFDNHVRDWVGSSPEERESALGLDGLLHTVGEVDTFVAGLVGAPKP